MMTIAPPTIYLTGTNLIQNTLLSHLIGQKTHLSCQTIADAQTILTTEGKAPSPCLILVDCHNMSEGEILAVLESASYLAENGASLALFNLQTDLGVEQEALKKGVRGLIYACDTLETLIKAVQTLLRGEAWVSRKVINKFLAATDQGQQQQSPQTSVPLTDRETEILSLVATGETNDTIADRLCISPHTVKTHIYNIFKKINVTNRLLAAKWAAKNLPRRGDTAH